MRVGPETMRHMGARSTRPSSAAPEAATTASAPPSAKPISTSGECRRRSSLREESTHRNQSWAPLRLREARSVPKPGSDIPRAVQPAFCRDSPRGSICAGVPGRSCTSSAAGRPPASRKERCSSPAKECACTAGIGVGTLWAWIRWKKNRKAPCRSKPQPWPRQAAPSPPGRRIRTKAAARQARSRAVWIQSASRRRRSSEESARLAPISPASAKPASAAPQAAAWIPAPRASVPPHRIKAEPPATLPADQTARRWERRR